MRDWSAQLAAMLLLLAQTMFGVVGGKVLCVELEHCGMHAGECHEHRSVANGTGGEEHRHDHDHRPINAESDCECHVHLAVPADEHVPSRSSAEARAAANFVAAAAPNLVAMPNVASPPGAEPIPPRRSWVTSGLRSTRLTV